MEYFAKRIIPCLDVDRGRVVKGVNFVGLRDAGDPIEVAKRYNREGADEITFLRNYLPRHSTNWRKLGRNYLNWLGIGWLKEEGLAKREGVI